jgi:hypothetical protein
VRPLISGVLAAPSLDRRHHYRVVLDQKNKALDI